MSKPHLDLYKGHYRLHWSITGLRNNTRNISTNGWAGLFQGWLEADLRSRFGSWKGAFLGNLHLVTEVSGSQACGHLNQLYTDKDSLASLSDSESKMETGHATNTTLVQQDIELLVQLLLTWDSVWVYLLSFCQVVTKYTWKIHWHSSCTIKPLKCCNILS